MYNVSTQATAVIFLRAHHQGQDNHDREIEKHMIAAQRAACEQAAKALDAKILREYVEYGGTGSIDKRPTLRLMLDELRALHDADYIIVTSLDRLARTTDDWATIRFELEAANTELIIATQTLTNTNRPARKEVTI